jgi:mxaA protein
LKNLKQLPEQASTSEQIEQAFRIVHRALNQTAGETVLESQLDYFYENHPQLAGLRSDTDLFFKQSRQIFYETSSLDNQQTQDNNLLKSLKHLCSRYDRLLKQR